RGPASARGGRGQSRADGRWRDRNRYQAAGPLPGVAADRGGAQGGAGCGGGGERMTNEMQGSDVLLKAEEALKKPVEKPERPAKADTPKSEAAAVKSRPSIRSLPRETLAIFEIVA